MLGRKKRKEESSKWAETEREQAEQAVRDSEEQLDRVKDLAQQSSVINRRFGFHRQRNMFAEGFRMIIREAHQ